MAEIGFCAFIIATSGNSTKPKYQVNVNRFYFSVQEFSRLILCRTFVSVGRFAGVIWFLFVLSSVQFRLKFITSFLFSVRFDCSRNGNKWSERACMHASRDFDVHLTLSCVCCVISDGISACYSHRISQFSRFSRLVCTTVCECLMITVIKSRKTLNHTYKTIHT